jgi:hypothetical protein
MVAKGYIGTEDVKIANNARKATIDIDIQIVSQEAELKFPPRNAHIVPRLQAGLSCIPSNPSA